MGLNINTIISIICLSLCIVTFFYFRWYIKRRLSASEFLAECQNEATRSVVEINAVTERNLTLVEDSIKQLKEIIQNADKRVKVYTQELERSKKNEAIYANLGRGIREALAVEDVELISLRSISEGMSSNAVKPSAGQAFGEAVSAQPAALTSSDIQTLPVSAPPANAPVSRKQIRSEIYSLSEAGLSHGEIASRLGISIPEVKLAIDLNKGGKK